MKETFEERVRLAQKAQKEHNVKMPLSAYPFLILMIPVIILYYIGNALYYIVTTKFEWVVVLIIAVLLWLKVS